MKHTLTRSLNSSTQFSIEPYYEQWDIGKSDLFELTNNGVPTGSVIIEPRSETRNIGINFAIIKSF